MSWAEVECKIRIPDKKVEEVRKKIKKISTYKKKEQKKDDYYSLEYFDYPQKSLRIRNKGKVREVNFKHRINYKNGIHAKNEVQFKISDTQGFFSLIEDFGFRKWMHKEKITELHTTKNGVGIELNHVKSLGWYVEIEVLTEKTPEKILAARKKVDNARKRLGFTKADVERRGYTKILWEQNKKNLE